MKRIMQIAAIIMGTVMFSSVANAIVVTDVNNPYKFLGEGQHYSVTHDLTDNGVPDQYQVTKAKIKLGFSDGYKHFDYEFDYAGISGEGISGIFEVDGTHRYGYDFRWLTVGQDGIDSLNNNGLLEVTVTALAEINGQYNDFYWKTSKLKAHIEKVSEPGTLALLGLGLAGLGFIRRKTANA